MICNKDLFESPTIFIDNKEFWQIEDLPGFHLFPQTLILLNAKLCLKNFNMLRLQASLMMFNELYKPDVFDFTVTDKGIYSKKITEYSKEINIFQNYYHSYDVLNVIELASPLFSSSTITHLATQAYPCIKKSTDIVNRFSNDNDLFTFCKSFLALNLNQRREKLQELDNSVSKTFVQALKEIKKVDNLTFEKKCTPLPKNKGKTFN